MVKKIIKKPKLDGENIVIISKVCLKIDKTEGSEKIKEEEYSLNPWYNRLWKIYNLEPYI
jgi:hypothetical protein